MSDRDAFDRVIESVKRIREPGEKPEDDLYSMDKFVCDLCKGANEREEITQCGFCGRWVCKGDDSCWNEELNACESCSGLIKLARQGGLEESKKEDDKDE